MTLSELIELAEKELEEERLQREAPRRDPSKTQGFASSQPIGKRNKQKQGHIKELIQIATNTKSFKRETAAEVNNELVQRLNDPASPNNEDQHEVPCFKKYISTENDVQDSDKKLVPQTKCRIREISVREGNFQLIRDWLEGSSSSIGDCGQT